MTEPQRKPWPRRWVTYWSTVLEQLNMSAKKIINLGAGSAGTTEGCNVTQMEAHVAAAIGDNVSKMPVDATTIGALPANTRTGDVLTATGVGAFPAIDGVAAGLDKSYLVKDEGGGATHINNGIYTLTIVGDGATAWELTRRSDLTDSEGASGAMTHADDGVVNDNVQFKCINNIGSDVVNTDALQFDFWGETVDHANLKNVTSDQHHAQVHAPSHTDGTDDIQDAGAAQKGIITAAAQTLAGDKTFNDLIKLAKGLNTEGYSIYHDNGDVYISAGTHYNGVNWIADNATAAILYISITGAQQHFYDTALTPTAIFVPTKIFEVDNTGSITTGDIPHASTSGQTANDHHTKYTDGEARLAVQYQSDVTLAGVAPVYTDLTGASWADGDRGMGIGTGGRVFYMRRVGAAGYYVEAGVMV